MTIEERKDRRKHRRIETRRLSKRAVRVFMGLFDLKESFHATTTRELAALCKAGHKIEQQVKDAQNHLDKRYERAKAERAKLQGNVWD